ncbi:conserved repeat domain-containing protein [Sulfitobacter brevis]|uniref:Conserved repeat domain-containing protein n=1 Tax=Sulfitobacter brevis TaxID=74348 RepID=A0A1I1TPI5_9RHOB|nr:GEVED domain-containing protein [Sulfitobacter brevis]SFD60429.1 conserved repeat domain-containing protein [Sulfitobacter brevis]
MLGRAARKSLGPQSVGTQFSGFLRAFCLLVSFVVFTILGSTGNAQQLILNPVGNPTVTGAGIGKRALWTNAGTVSGASVDIVAVMTSTALNHTFATGNNQIQITSVNQDPHFVDFHIYQAGTYNLGTNSGGVPVIADVHIQINDIDGPANEQVYVEICDGTVEYVRIDKSATTYRGYIEGPDANLGTEVFYLAGDQQYFNEPVSGLEISYPQTSTFSFGRTANSGFLVRVANPTYNPCQTYDLRCADFKAPVLQNDVKEQVLGEPVVLNILFNDSVATENNNPPANNSLQPSEYAKQAIDLIPPSGAFNLVFDAEGHRIGFDVLGEGTWSYEDLTGELTFTPFAAFFAGPTAINYRFETPVKLPGEPIAYSAPAQVSIDVGSVGLLKLATLVDTNLNGYADAGETIAYVFTAENFGNVDLTNVQLAETQFSGAGIPPVITFQAASALSPEGTLLVGERAFYTATYTLVPADLDTTISNQAEVTAETPGGTTVSDLSDSENPGDGDGVASNGPGDGRDDPTTIYAGSGPDRGDAPVTYGDPQHANTASYWIGPLNGDGDGSTQHSVDASGDDLDGKDDESDETFPQLYGDLTRTVTVEVHEPNPGSGRLQAFIDFGGDGTFLSLGDQVATDIQDGGAQDLDGVANGQISFAVSVPITAVLTPTFARLRWSSIAAANAISTVADGEVEDYSITIKTPPDADRGDAPASYGDPQHIIEGLGAPEIYLGTVPPDIDILAQNSATATGDDLDGGDDEDGVVMPTLYRGGFSQITVSVNDLGTLPEKNAYLQAFIDFNGDGTFNQAGEQVALNLQDGDPLDKDGTTDRSITFEVAVPAGATTAPTFARFRWSTDNTGLNTVFDGEVEDYALTISSDPPPVHLRCKLLSL